MLFCAVSGGVYLINDLFDIERDRAHPVKRLRPIASGQLPVGAAKLSALGLILGAVGLGSLLSPLFAGVLASYAVLNLLYSIVLKHVVFLDVTVIATGFLLRVLGGALVIAVPISAWLIVCTFLLSLYLALGKRMHELLTVGAKPSRKVLENYVREHVRTAMFTAAAVTTCSYAGYTIDPATVAQFDTHWLPVTVPLIGLGLFRFYRLVQSPDLGSPTELMLRDMLFLGTVLSWLVTTLALIYA